MSDLPDIACGMIQFLTLAVTFIVFALTGLYGYSNGSVDDTLLFLAIAATAGGTILTANYSARALTTALGREQTMAEREQALDLLGMKQRAMRYAERWQDPHMHYGRDTCRKTYEMVGRPAVDIIAFGENSANKTNLTNMLNFFEELSFAVDHSLADEELAREQFSGIISTVFSILKPWIDHVRATRQKPRIWIELESLNTKWR